MRGTLDNLHASRSAADALTGPLQRGDTTTLSRHLTVLSGPSRALYQELAGATLPLTTHSPEMLHALAEALELRGQPP